MQRMCGRAFLLGVALLLAELAHAQSDRHDPTERAIREAAYEFYRDELRQLARGDALDNDPAAFDAAQAVFARVERAAKAWFPHTAEWAFELHVSARLEGAWSAPGCKLMVGTALARRLAHDEAALAFVIGHEIAHCTMEHSRALIDAMVDHEPRLARLHPRDLLWMIDGDLRTVLRLAPVSRRLEEEADLLGMVLAAAAGYDPNAMLRYFELAEDATGLLAATHATRARRLAALAAMAPASRTLFERYRP